jgi:hypothetical protein
MTEIIECKECGRYRGAEHPRCEVCGSDWSREVEQEITGSTSDGYHTFDELYAFRMLYHAAFVKALPTYQGRSLTPTTVKSWKHSDGEPCFGGGWFIVVTTLPTGQISNHYEAQHWSLFEVSEVDLPPAYDGHDASDVLNRLRAYLESR